MRGRIRSVAWILLVALLLTFTVAVLGVGVFVRQRFEMTLPQDFFRMSVRGEAPRFFAYDFRDRTNRHGERVELTSAISGKRTHGYLAYPDMPQHLIASFVAIEDKRFFEHRGVDWYRTVAAGANYVLGFSDHFGASTITQQVIKNMTGNSEVSLARKLQEILYARDLERRLDKSQILELYLNIIHFSDGCDGIVSAADHYFSKTPQQLTVAEAATLAAITNSPSYYNPIRHPEHNLARRNLILSEMNAQGYLSDGEYEAAVSSPLGLSVSDLPEGEEINSWYLDMVIDDVIDDLVSTYGLSRSAASALVYRGGLRIDVAMDREVQKTVEDYYRMRVKTPTNADGVPAQSALIVIDPHTGDVLGVAGGVGEKRGNRVQNFATQTLRPPGSAIKPISVYAPALEEGLINWASVYDDTPVNFGENGKAAWPKNATNVYRGLTNIAYAVAHSTNTVAVRVLEELGVEKSYSWAKDRFHLTALRRDAAANDCDVAALALGQLNYGVTLREITDAYTVFADEGVYHPWRSYYRVLDADGGVLLSKPDCSEIVMSRGNAAIMTRLLEGVVKYGTSSAITLDRTVACAGKTGTTSADRDRWFIGYTPELICGVWCGYEYPEPLVGRNLCTSIWNDVMGELSARRGGKTSFEMPSSVVKLEYCRDSGKLLGENCTADPRGNRVESGWFLSENAPTEVCDRHVLCDCDSLHGGISHGLCPAETVERVSLIRVERRFPIQIYVTDAQYVYTVDPSTVAPNPDPKRAYFDMGQGAFYGASHTNLPFNRSCITHFES